MKDAMLQVQLLVPSIKADATVTANVKRGEELELELESDIKLPETTSVQKITLKYGMQAFNIDQPLYDELFCFLINFNCMFLRALPGFKCQVIMGKLLKCNLIYNELLLLCR